MKDYEKSEKWLEEKLVSEARRMGFVVIKNFDPMRCGMPDRLIALPGGRCVWVEVKSHGKKPGKLQMIRMQELVNLGHVVFVCDSVETLNMVLTYIRKYQVQKDS